LRNAVGVIRCSLQAAKNEHFKRALEQFEGVPLIVYRRHPTYLRPQNIFVKCLGQGFGFSHQRGNPRQENQHKAASHRVGAQHTAPVPAKCLVMFGVCAVLEAIDWADQVPVNCVKNRKRL